MRRILYFLLLLLVASCKAFNSIPQPKTEFRGVWVATVVNIDWPKNGNDAVKKKKSDFLEILDFYQALKFNAVIVQIRTAGDAFYPSEYAPWSRFLTGTEGEAPKIQDDLLSWMIHETHKKGMEFHAWLNPYRATFDLKIEVLSPTHDFYLHPEWMIKYGNKYYYDPGLPQVRKRLVDIMREVVAKYNVDAIHFDDYFYPYKIKGEVFDDSLSYSFYAKRQQSLEDWRRSNVDSLIKNIHKTIKKQKPWVQFGVSPFGVWKNNTTDPRGSNTKAGQTTYEDLYADPLLWMQKGWLDYVVPQAYWSMEMPAAPHKEIVHWWSNNSLNTNLYMGNGAYKIRNNSDKAWERKKELPNQIKLARKTEAVKGNVFFSAKSLIQKNHDVVDYLKKKYYKDVALPPTSPLASKTITHTFELLETSRNNEVFMFRFKDLTDFRYALVYKSGRNKKSFYETKKLLRKIFLNGADNFSISAKAIENRRYVAITFVDKFGKESNPMVINLKHQNGIN